MKMLCCWAESVIVKGRQLRDVRGGALGRDGVGNVDPN